MDKKENERFAVVEEHFEYDGRDCIVIFNKMGFRCGYVSINEDDNGFEIVEKDFFGKTYTELNYSNLNIDCHGGLTFGNELNEDFEPKSKYYIGFDCGHYGDKQDFRQAMEYGFNISPEFSGGEVRTKEYCIKECKLIAEQLNKVLLEIAKGE